MKKYPVVAKSFAVQAKKQHAVETRKGRTLEGRGDAFEPLGLFGGSFMSFRYSYTEITAAGAKARVKAHRARYENGKLESERFEGNIDRGEYERRLADAHRHFAEQTASMLRSVFSFFPRLGRLRSEED